MVGFKRPNKEQARRQMKRLVERFETLHRSLTSPETGFTETETRTQYIDEFLKILGWDVSNEAGHTTRKAEVVQERTHTTTSSAHGRPDYILRVNGKDKLPVEAKKAAFNFDNNSEASRQIRAYGWTLNTPIGILTNFTETRIYSTLTEPKEFQSSDHELIPGCCWKFSDYVARFDEIWDHLSFESVSTDRFKELYGKTRNYRGDSEFDESFLDTFRAWRQNLGQAIHNQNKGLPAAEVGRLTQKVLNALLFMRVCEDREILKYRQLLDQAQSSHIVKLFKQRDKTFNAGIFRALEGIELSDSSLVPIIQEMYWPSTKFSYGLLRPATLAFIYEQYLSEHFEFSNGTVTLTEKPEILHAGGVASTPMYIIQRLVTPAIDQQYSSGVIAPNILDLAVGSGGFLLAAFEHLVELKERELGRHLTLQERAYIAENQIFGIDIDGAAVEVTRLSILLSVLGDAEIDTATAQSVLPDLKRNIVVGNSVVREDFDHIVPTWASNLESRQTTLPLDIEQSLGEKYPSEGFDVIVGNPPYVRIQVLSEYFPAQLAYFQSQLSKYASATSGSFDLYMIFVERALSLLNPTGNLAMILPNRFLNTQPASAIRSMLSRRIHRLVDFGVQQVFMGRTTYTTLVFAGAPTTEKVKVDLVSNLEAWIEDESSVTQSSLNRKSLGSKAWKILTPAQIDLFAQMFAESDSSLEEEAEVFVGVQTSADEIFFIKNIQPVEGRPDLVSFIDIEGDRETIERSILKPAIKDVKISSLDGEPSPDRWAIFPYVTERKPSGRLANRVFTYDELKKSFPYALAYFSKYKDLLAKRSISPNPQGKYWSYGRSQSLTKLDDPKLIVRVLSLKPSYAYDSNGLVTPGGGDGGPYYLIRAKTDSKYTNELLHAILSHPAVDQYVTATGKKYRGNYAVHRKAFLTKVPLPRLTPQDADRITNMVVESRDLSIRIRSETDSLRKSVAKNRKDFLYSEINTIISVAYKLSDEQIKTALVDHSLSATN